MQQTFVTFANDAWDLYLTTRLAQASAVAPDCPEARQLIIKTDTESIHRNIRNINRKVFAGDPEFPKNISAVKVCKTTPNASLRKRKAAGSHSESPFTKRIAFAGPAED